MAGAEQSPVWLGHREDFRQVVLQDRTVFLRFCKLKVKVTVWEGQLLGASSMVVGVALSPAEVGHLSLISQAHCLTGVGSST